MSWNMFSRFGDGSNSDIVSFGELEEAIKTNAWTVVDVREPHEFATGHIPNALNIPMSSFDPKKLPQGKPVVLICHSGDRSCNALSEARAIGREDVRHFAGGIERLTRGRATVLAVGTFDLKLELDQWERRTVSHCLLARRSRLIETIGDTTRTTASRRTGSRELELVESVLRKLRLFDPTHDQPRIDAD